MSTESSQTPLCSATLTKLHHVRAEIGKVYRLSRNGKIHTQDLSRFVYALREIAQIIETINNQPKEGQLENPFVINIMQPSAKHPLYGTTEQEEDHEGNV